MDPVFRVRTAYHGLLRTSYRSILFGVLLLSTHGEAEKQSTQRCSVKLLSLTGLGDALVSLSARTKTQKSSSISRTQLAKGEN